MCRSWERTHECPRLKRGDTCLFEHPPTHVPPTKTKVCHAFETTGHCDRGTTCLFASSHVRTAATGSVGGRVPLSSVPVASAVVNAAPAFVAPSLSLQPSTSPAITTAPSNGSVRLTKPNSTAPITTAAAPLSTPTKPTSNKRKPTATTTSQPMNETMMDVDDDVSGDVATPDETNASHKKQKKTTTDADVVAAIKGLTQPNSWAALTQAHEDEEEKATSGAAAATTRTIIPTSSLSAVGSPTKTTSTSGRGPGPGRPSRTASATRTTTTAAAAATQE
jgi:hypothetical protein